MHAHGRPLEGVPPAAPSGEGGLPNRTRMLPYLTRVSFWLAALAAGLSLFTPGARGALLASVGMVALIAALVLRRFTLKAGSPAAALDVADPYAPDHAEMLELAVVLMRAVVGAPTLDAGLDALRHALIHELGAREVMVHESAPGVPLVVPQRYPLGEAAAADAVTGSAAGGFALPVQREGEVVAMLSLAGTALDIDAVTLAQLLTLLKVALDALARREAAERGAPATPARRDDASGLRDGRASAAPDSPVDAAAAPDSPVDAAAAPDSPVDAAAAPDSPIDGAAAADRRRADLEEACRRFAELADAMQDTLFVADPQRSRFEFMSASAYDTFGVSREAVQARPAALLDHVVEEDRPLLAQRAEAERRGEAADVTYRLRHPHKGLRFIRTRSRTRLLPDGSARVYGLVSDITRDREHEAALERARDEAEAASRAKSQFMANMSHEIRTPMNGVLGMTELLLGTPLDDTQRRFARAVYRSGESLLEIIDDVLDFSAIEAGRLTLAPADFALRALVEDTLELLAPRAHEKLLELHFEESPGLPARVHGDAPRLRQVLTHLVGNAIKFTDRGEVVVRLEQVHAGDGDAPGRVLLEFGVRDTGIGIDAATLPRLFGAFTQAQGGPARRYGGTGLGLAVSKQLVEMMGGRIGVQSVPGAGSTFTFRVPLQPAAGEAACEEPAGGVLSGVRALVVDDHAGSRGALADLLTAWGLEVTPATDGQHAIEMLRDAAGPARRFDVALVDHRMPRLDGLGFARALRAQGRHPGLALVLLGPVGSAEELRQAQAAGFQRFVAKPVRRSELRQALLGVSAQQRPGPLSTLPRLAGSVLVVEDNAVNQEVIAQMLRQAGAKVRLAASAAQGLKALCEAHFDLVLMDIQMPGMDGVEALGLFRRGGDGRFAFVTPTETPVVAVTANALEGDQARFLAHGFDDYLSKPFRHSQLLAMLTQRLRARPAAAASDNPAGGNPARRADGPWVLPEGTESVLDAGALERLRELDPKGENQLLERVIQAFDASAARLLPQLEQARAAGDTLGIRHVAHTLKSSSASIGAIKLSQLCADIESRIRTDQLHNVDEHVDALRAEIEIVLQALKRLLDATS